MKTLSLMLIPICLLAACKKETTVTPKTDTQSQTSSQTTTSQTSTTSSTSNQSSTTSGTKPTGTTTTTAADTIPDKALLKVKLVKDSINYDETILMFDHTAPRTYDVSYDSPYMQGFGQESLSSLSSDGRELVMNTMPYKAGVPVALDVNVKSDGAFALQVSYLKSVPADIQVIVRDSYLKDSLDIRANTYKFKIVKSDAATYGASRFSVVFRNKTH